MNINTQLYLYVHLYYCSCSFCFVELLQSARMLHAGFLLLLTRFDLAVLAVN